MPTFTLTLDRLPGLDSAEGPFEFKCDWNGSIGVLTIPIVNRGPESFAVSLQQEQWVSRRYPGLEMCFAGAWRTEDRALFDRASGDLSSLAGGPSGETRQLLAELSGYCPVLKRAPNGHPAFSAVADCTEEERSAARAEDLARHDRLLALAPAEPAAWLLRAARRRTDHLDRAGALADYQRASELAPGNTEAWSGMGWCLLELDRAAEAVPAFQRALLASSSKDESRGARVALAYAHSRAGQHEAAVQQLARVAAPSSGKAKRPLDGPLHQSRARALAALGRVPEALEAWSDAARCTPREATPHTERARLLWTLEGREDEALVESVLGMERVQAWEVEPLWIHGGILRHRERFDDALPVLEEALRRSPDHLGVVGELGVVLARLGHHERALGLLDRYLAASSWWPALLARALARWRGRGDKGGALEDLARVLEADPGNTEAAALRGELLQDPG